MARSARVESIDALKELRTFLCSLARKITVSLDEADFDIRQTMDWLKNDQLPYWKSQQAKWNDELVKARLELKRKQSIEKSMIGGNYSHIDEKKAFELAKRRSEDAEKKLDAVRGWIPKLEKQAYECQAKLQGLANLIQLDLPNKRTQIDQMIYALESYADLAAPNIKAPEGPAEAGAEDNFSRPVEKTAKETSGIQLLCEDLKNRNPLNDLTLELPFRKPDFKLFVLNNSDKAFGIISGNITDEAWLADNATVAFDDSIKASDFIYLDKIFIKKDKEIKIHIGSVKQEVAANYSACAISDFLDCHPTWRNLFLLPKDWLVMIKDGSVFAILDADDNLIYQVKKESN